MIDAKISRLWDRRICQTAIIVGLVITGGYFLPALAATYEVIGELPNITEPVLFLAGITLITAVLTYVYQPKHQQIWLSFITYTLLWASVATLIWSTGGAFSPFIALWLPAVIFGGVFGARGLLPVLILPVIYLVWLFITGEFIFPSALSLLLAGEIPPILSFFIFTKLASRNADHSYEQLATEYSQVSGKAEAVIGAISNGVVSLNAQGVIDLINPAAQRLIGWSSRDALKLNYRSVLKLANEKGEELAPGSDPIAKALAGNEEVRTDTITVITNSGKKLLVSMVVSPVGQAGSGAIVVFRDVTKERTEERQQTEFISTASHEMRTPVASIEGYLGLALNPATARIDDKARDYIQKAHEVAQHLGRLFQDLLDVTKAEDGRLSNNPRAVEVVSFVQNIAEGLKPKAEAKGLMMVYKPIPEEGDDDKTSRRLNPVYYINVDNDHFREVVSNLIENAIKYTNKGMVTIDVTGNEKTVEVSVQDTGIGIPAEDLPHLFQKFYRVDNSDTREIGGTGLGLYLSRRLAEAMGGRVWAESQYKEGSTFRFEVPRISHQEAMQLIETIGNDEAPISAEATASTNPAQTQSYSQPTPEATQSTTQNDGVFVSVPAEQVAAQLTTQPPASNRTMTNPPPSTQAAPGGGQATLAAIEQNPEQYLQQRDDVSSLSQNQNQP